MSRAGIIAAFSGELKPLVRDWQPIALTGGGRRWSAWKGSIGRKECIAVAAGMGRAAAERACGIAEEAGELDSLVSLGWAGALSCGVSPATAYALAEVVDHATGERFATGFSPDLLRASGAPLTLVTTGYVVPSTEKRGLAQSHHAVLVDMEAAAVARFAHNKGLAFYCFKAVTDAYGERLPDFGRYTDAEGGLRIPALLAYLAVRPRYWQPVKRMEENSRSGAEAVAAALREFYS